MTVFKYRCLLVLIVLTTVATFVSANKAIQDISQDDAALRELARKPSILFEVGYRANLRACPLLDCEVIASLEAGEDLEIFDGIIGEAFGDNDLWFRTIYDDQIAYVNSRVVVGYREGVPILPNPYVPEIPLNTTQPVATPLPVPTTVTSAQITTPVVDTNVAGQICAAGQCRPAVFTVGELRRQNAILFEVAHQANLRTCPAFDCEIVAVLEDGETLSAFDGIIGDAFGDNELWFRTIYDGQIAYVQSRVVSGLRSGVPIFLETFDQLQQLGLGITFETIEPETEIVELNGSSLPDVSTFDAPAVQNPIIRSDANGSFLDVADDTQEPDNAVTDAATPEEAEAPFGTPQVLIDIDELVTIKDELPTYKVRRDLPARDCLESSCENVVEFPEDTILSVKDIEETDGNTDWLIVDNEGTDVYVRERATDRVEAVSNRTEDTDVSDPASLQVYRVTRDISGNDCMEDSCETVVTFLEGAMLIVKGIEQGPDDSNWLVLEYDGMDLFVPEQATEVVELVQSQPPPQAVVEQPDAVTESPAQDDSQDDSQDEEDDTPDYYYVIESADVYACPQADCQILGTLPAGHQLPFQGNERGDALVGNNRQWRIVDFNGQQGYVHSGLVSDLLPTTYYVTNSTARARSCPRNDDAECPVLFELQYGDAVQIFDATTGRPVSGNRIWRIGIYEGERVFIFSGLLSDIPPT